MASLVNLTEKPLSKLHLSEITTQASKKRGTIIEIPIKLIGSIGLSRCKMDLPHDNNIFPNHPVHKTNI